MSEKTETKRMRCPECGANLKALNDRDAIPCAYCGETVVPINEAATPETGAGANNTVRVEGIKTSSSALAYMEQFFEEYDWDAYAYAQTLTIRELDRLAASLKVSSADDKNTWFVCFRAICTPYLRKAEACRGILDTVIEEYRKGDLDAYSKFDAYRRIASMLKAARQDTMDQLEKIVEKAEKYGASATEVSGLQADINAVRSAYGIRIYDRIEEVPDIAVFLHEERERITRVLAEAGIRAEAEYARAKQMIAERRYVDALDLLRTLRGYEDSEQLIGKIDKYFLMDDVVEIAGRLYRFRKDKDEKGTYQLYPTVDGEMDSKPVIKNLGHVITNYADILYYFDGKNRLRKYNLSTHVGEKIGKETYDPNTIFCYNRRAFLLMSKGSESVSTKHVMVELDLASGTTETVREDVGKIESLTGNKMIYTASETVEGTSAVGVSRTVTYILNVDTRGVTNLGAKNVVLHGFLGNRVIYTQDSPNANNQNLYSKTLESDEPEQLIEKNIYRFSTIVGGRLFYYVGNSRSYSLIRAHADGSERGEWLRYVSKILLEQGGWLYFIRKAGYDSILCKARPDGSEFTVIAADVEEFVSFKNGYLYYLNDLSSLIKVRMDGSNQQELCGGVDAVLAIREDKIVFVSRDDDLEGSVVGLNKRAVKSIYSLDFSGCGKIKLAYDVTNVKRYDENTVYFIGAEEIKESYETLDLSDPVLYRLDVETGKIERLLTLSEPPKEGHGFLIAMIIMGFFLFLALIGALSDNGGLTAVGLIGAVISLVVGLLIKFSKK